MGTLTLSGVLKRPISGDVVPNARITFDAIATGNVVLKGVSSSCKTASDGSYSVDLEYGEYTIQVSWAGQTQQYGTVHIDDTTPVGSLNDLLMQELTESQLTPEIVLEFRQLEQEMQDDLAQMEDLNTEAAGSASAAASSATAAATSETNASASEDAAAVSASEADASAKSIEGDADAAAASAKAAATSETNAAASEDAAASSATAANTSETKAAGSEAASAASAAAAQVSESNSAANEMASDASASAAKTSENNAASSEEAAANSEINSKNARDAAEEYAHEAKDASSKVTAPLTDQGKWLIQSGYPITPGVASIWQITDGGVDPVNTEIIWDAGDMLVYLATTGTWCRLLGQQTVAGEPVPLKIDADIILNVGSGLQIVTSGTTAVDIARLDTDNNLVLGDGAVPGICLNAAEPTNLFVLVSDGNGGYTKSRIYTEAFPPPEGVTKINGEAGDVEITLSDLGAGTAATLDATTSTTDDTLGHVLRVGDRNLARTTIENSVSFDFNTYKFAVGESLFITMASAKNIPDELSDLSAAYAYLSVLGVNNVELDTLFYIADFSTNEGFFCSRISEDTGIRWEITKLPTSAADVAALSTEDGGTVKGTVSVLGDVCLIDSSGVTRGRLSVDTVNGRFSLINDIGGLSIGMLDSGFITMPTVTGLLPIGDADTGIVSGGDGVLLLRCNGIDCVRITTNADGVTGLNVIYGDVYDNGNWVYSAAHPPPAQTQASLGSNGWEFDNNTKRIKQWGTSTSTGDTVTIYFPMAFPVDCYNFRPFFCGDTAEEVEIKIKDISNTRVILSVNIPGGLLMWDAIGE